MYLFEKIIDKYLSESYKMKKISEPRQSSQGDMMSSKWLLSFKHNDIPENVWDEFDNSIGNYSPSSDDLLILIRALGFDVKKAVSKWTSSRYAPYVFYDYDAGRVRIDPAGDWDVKSSNSENYIRLSEYSGR